MSAKNIRKCIVGYSYFRSKKLCKNHVGCRPTKSTLALYVLASTCSVHGAYYLKYKMHKKWAEKEKGKKGLLVLVRVFQLSRWLVFHQLAASTTFELPPYLAYALRICYSYNDLSTFYERANRSKIMNEDNRLFTNHRRTIGHID